MNSQSSTRHGQNMLAQHTYTLLAIVFYSRVLPDENVLQTKSSVETDEFMPDGATEICFFAYQVVIYQSKLSVSYLLAGCAFKHNNHSTKF